MRKWNYLLPLVFLTGAAVLVIEVVAVRILSPYFGNTIFNFSSVLTTILLALSCGYYYGGLRADKNPSEKHFFSLIGLSGILVLIFHACGLFLLPVLAYALSTIEGPLLTALLLFFVPSVFLGMLSPYAIKLQAERFPERGIGRISGTTFFWSTFGSISGSLGAGFVLIPYFGVNQIMLGTGILLVLLGACGVIISPVDKAATVGRSVAGLLLAFTIPFIPSFEAEALYSRDGVYERISVWRETIDDKSSLVLRQDKTMSGAVFEDSNEPAFPVLRFYHLAELIPGGPKRVLVIGGGAFLVPKMLLQEFPQAVIDVVEIEPKLQNVAQEYFGLPKSERLRVHISDGRRFLHDVNEPYDLIFGDAYHSLYSIPAHFTTKEFFSLVRSKLSAQGLFFGNFIGSISRSRPSLTMSEMRTFKESFPESHFFAAESASFYDPQNLIFIGFGENNTLSFEERMRSLAPTPFFQQLPALRVDANRFALDRYELLTDDYSPVDYMTSRVARLHARRLTDSTALDSGELMELEAQLGSDWDRLGIEMQTMLNDGQFSRSVLSGWLGQADAKQMQLSVESDPGSRALALLVLQTIKTRHPQIKLRLSVRFLNGSSEQAESGAGTVLIKALNGHAPSLMLQPGDAVLSPGEQVFDGSRATGVVAKLLEWILHQAV